MLLVLFVIQSPEEFTNDTTEYLKYYKIDVMTSTEW